MKTSVLLLALFSSLAARADIVGGEEVRNPSDPTRKSIAALYEPSRSGLGGALCTASLIGPNTAVTAAHCVDPGGPKPVLIFGSNVRASDSERRRVTDVAVNPRWNSRQGVGMDQGDIALVRFDGGIPGGYQPISMMNRDTALKKGESVILAGYGIADARAHAGAGTLRKTRVKVDDPRAGKSEMILDQSHGHGACHGDSGGPAYVRQGGRVVLAGVTNRSYPASAPDDCAHQVVYTKVAAYQPWIRQTRRKFESKNSYAGRLPARKAGTVARHGAMRSARRASKARTNGVGHFSGWKKNARHTRGQHRKAHRAG